MDKIYVGNICGFHGVKGEVKVLSDFELKEKVFRKNFVIYIDDDKKIISSSRIHKNNYLITIDDITSLNDAEVFLKKDIFIDRCDLNLSASVYLINDLIGFNVYDEEKMLGKVVEISYNIKNKFLVVTGEKTFLVPFIDVYIKKVCLDEKKVITSGGSDLIL